VQIQGRNQAGSDATPKLRNIGKYHLIASLGQGGMAKVYLALLAGPAGFNKLLVIKVLRDDVLGGAEEGVHMFWDEARLAARLVHPNIVHTFEVGETDGSYFLAMEYLDGQSYREIQNRARNQGGLPLHEELRILADVARGLHYSHELRGYNGEPLGVVHRDVSPQNVFLTYDGQVKLLDFGIAKTHDAEHMTQVGVIKGKLDYIAPEQLRGEQLDGRADVFALGAMMWEAITGQRFAGGRKVTDVTKVHLRLSGGEPKLREVKPEVPEPLALIVDRAVAIDPAQRFATAGEFADAVEEYLNTIGAKPTAKSLGALIGPMFATERASMQKLIDEQVRLTKSGVLQLAENTGDLPQLGRAQQASTSGVYVGEATNTGSRSHQLSIANETPVGTMTPKKSKTGLLVAVAAAAVAGAAFALFLPSGDAPSATAPTTATPAPVTSQPAASAPSAPTAPATPVPAKAEQPSAEDANTVTIGIKVMPQEAQVTLDGASLPVPFSGEFRKGGALHHVEAAANGYRPFKRLITFDRDQQLEIVLERAPQPTPRRPARAEPTAERRPEAVPEEPKQPTPAAADKPQQVVPGGDLGTVRPRVKRGDIDLSDPYAN
jgi:eukaryotic-like serine/threonine-protein kinase